MTRLSKDFRVIEDPKKQKQFWLPLNASLNTIMEETGANHYSKHFFGQQHLKTLVLFQMTDGTSLEDLHQAINEDIRFRVYTHCPPVSKSQLSRANRKRPLEAFHRVFLSLTEQLPSRDKLSKPLKGLRERIKIFDGTYLELNPHYCPWAIYREQFDEPDAGFRMTLRLDLNRQAPDRVFIHPYRDNSANYFRACLDFDQKGFLYLFDREFNHHKTLETIALSDNSFVTPLKSYTHYDVLKEQVVPRRFRHGIKILKDQIVLMGKKLKQRVKLNLRRIEAIDKEGHLLVFLTSIFHLAASTLANIYRWRWQIEIFFKWIKQHLKIKRFISYSLNGILLQIYSALILYLLLALFKYFNNLEMSLYNIMRKLRAKMAIISPVIVIEWEKLKLPNQLSKSTLQGVTSDAHF